jgi:iron complex transport system substrate-binding protein
MAPSARGAERLSALGLTVLALEPKSYADVQRVMGLMAQALGLPVQESERAWHQIDAAVNDAAQSIPQSAKGQRVYVEVGTAPYGASESSFIGETLQRLGLRNILPASLGPFPKINPEFVVRAQPDIIMVGDSSFAEMAARPGWQSMRAMRTQRVCHFKPEESDMLVRAGPRMAEGARVMAKCLTDMANDPTKGQP